MSANRLFNVLLVFVLLVAAVLVINGATAARAPKADGRAAAGDLAAYHRSERGAVTSRPPSFNEAGWAMYYASERGTGMTPAARPDASGLAIYHDSEWNRTGSSGTLASEAGLAIYHQSEWGR